MTERRIRDTAETSIHVIVRFVEADIINEAKIIVQLIEIFFAERSVIGDADITVNADPPGTKFKLRCKPDKQIWFSFEDARTDASADACVLLAWVGRMRRLPRKVLTDRRQAKSEKQKAKRNNEY